MFLALALALSSPGLLAAEGQEVDVAVVANDANDAVGSDAAVVGAAVEAVRGAVVVAARERDVRVVDLLGQGLARQWQACRNVIAAVELGCRRDLATRRGAEWHVVVDVDDDIGLRLLDGEKLLSQVKLQGPRFAQLARVPAAVDELLDRVRPKAEIQRARVLIEARDRRRQNDLAGAADAYRRAFALVTDDRAVEVALGRCRVLDEAGDDAAVDVAYDEAEAVLLHVESPLSPPARARFTAALQEHLWERASLLSAIADADRGLDHASLAAAAFRAWQRLASSTWADRDARARAAEQGARYGIDAVIPSTP